jgi:hypothetical protein
MGKPLGKWLSLSLQTQHGSSEFSPFPDTKLYILIFWVNIKALIITGLHFWFNISGLQNLLSANLQMTPLYH